MDWVRFSTIKSKNTNSYIRYHISYVISNIVCNQLNIYTYSTKKDRNQKRKKNNVILLVLYDFFAPNLMKLKKKRQSYRGQKTSFVVLSSIIDSYVKEIKRIKQFFYNFFWLMLLHLYISL